MSYLHLPENPRERAYFSVFWLGGVYTFIYEYFVVLPSYPPSDFIHIHIFSLVFFTLQAYANMWMIITTDVTVKKLENTDSELDSGWKYCEKCEMNCPPRSHHCKRCDVCILKRDHHCMFAGYCIGFQNRRHFIALILYCGIAGIYANIYNLEFFLATRGGFSWTTIPVLLAPHVPPTFGYGGAYEFMVNVSTSTSMIVTLFFMWLTGTQAIQMIQGQTAHEYRKGITDYKTTFRGEFREVFGTSGIWSILYPFLSTNFPHDGSVYVKNKPRHE